VSLRTGAAVHRSLVVVATTRWPSMSDRRSHRICAIRRLPLHFWLCMDRAGKMERFKDPGNFENSLHRIRHPASAISMHKSPQKHSWLQRVFLYRLARSSREGPRSPAHLVAGGKLRWPIVVKPASQGSTIGVTIVRKPSQWRDALALAHRYDMDAIVEAYIPGHEVTVSIIGDRMFLHWRSCRGNCGAGRLLRFCREV